MPQLPKESPREIARETPTTHNTTPLFSPFSHPSPERERVRKDGEKVKGKKKKKKGNQKKEPQKRRISTMSPLPNPPSPSGRVDHIHHHDPIYLNPLSLSSSLYLSNAHSPLLIIIPTGPHPTTTAASTRTPTLLTTTTTSSSLTTLLTPPPLSLLRI